MGHRAYHDTCDDCRKLLWRLLYYTGSSMKVCGDEGEPYCSLRFGFKLQLRVPGKTPGIV